MFISANFLGIQYGVNDKIARFFADREPPANNLYWKDKLLYLRPEPGWLFIPLIADLLYRCGVDREQLLNDPFIGVMENIGHISALEETRQLTHSQAIEKCIELVKGQCESDSYFNNLVDFMSGGSNNPFVDVALPLKALHRGDYFLFSLCVLKFDESLQVSLVKNWFALIGTLLLLDDASDLFDDEKTGDANAFLESGLDKPGVDRVVELVRSNLRQIDSVNKTMAKKLDKGFIALAELPHINKLLNQ